MFSSPFAKGGLSGVVQLMRRLAYGWIRAGRLHEDRLHGNSGVDSMPCPECGTICRGSSDRG